MERIRAKYFVHLVGMLIVGVLGIAFPSATASAHSEPSLLAQSDTLNSPTGLIPISDTLSQTGDTLRDSLSLAPRSKSALETTVSYVAQDSVYINMRTKRATIYNKGEVDYGKVHLKAGEIQMGFSNQDVLAIPLTDSAGKQTQLPHFKDETQEFDAKQIIYNFKSQKARIKDVITKEGEMYMHGQVVKKMDNNTTYVRGARFTTCDLDHPHFYIASTRAKIIPEDKVLVGGSMLFLNDVPTPLALPFAFFPNTSERASGIIVPYYGEMRSKGFFLRNGGFYWNISDYFDWKITGDIYTRGDWAINNYFNYAKRYKFKGSFQIDYSMNQTGEKFTSNFRKSTGLIVRWQHQQDPKANPNVTFSANVDFQNSVSKNFSTNVDDLINNNSRSSINYNINFPQGFRLNLNASQSYNISSREMTFNLPTVSFSMDPIYPLRPKVRKGASKWYESLKITYSADATNSFTAADSAIFSKETLDAMRNGIRHNVGTNIDIKLFKGKINWGIRGELQERWTFQGERRYVSDSGQLVSDRYNTFGATHQFQASTSLSTTLYGMATFKKGPIRAFRHQLMPSVGLSYAPDNRTYNQGFREYTDVNGRRVEYNLYETSPYGVPTNGPQGMINFSLGNRFEMKVRNRNDTVTGTKKIILIENLSLGTSYNMMADSLNWQSITLSARTRLFNLINVSFNTAFSLYAKDSLGRSINKYVWEEDAGKFLLKNNQSFSLSFDWTTQSKQTKKKDPDAQKDDPIRYVSAFSDNRQILRERPDFDVPWSFNLSYSMGFSTQYLPKEQKQSKARFTQSLNVSGQISLTEKWKISIRTGYDFDAKTLSLTELEITRDLHCWEMSMRWVPFGPYKEWSFSIRNNSKMLGDLLKYDKQKSRLDNDSYL